MTTVASPTFPVSELPTRIPGLHIRTAAVLVIGDEVLNGKTLDRNSNYFAKWCFDHGVQLKRIEVIADDKEEIMEASRRMAATYDFVVSSGGIGPTHDDITYPSIGAAFNQTLVHHFETVRRMEAMMKWREEDKRVKAIAAGESPEETPIPSAEQTEARKRMALFPQHATITYVSRDIWVPVICVAKKIHILPGIPSLFQRMLDGLTPYLSLPPANEKKERLLVFTKLPESTIAPFLTKIQARVEGSGVQVGSYPVWGGGVYVSLIAKATENLKELAEEVAKELQGHVLSSEEMKEKRDKEDARP